MQGEKFEKRDECGISAANQTWTRFLEEQEKAETKNFEDNTVPLSESHQGVKGINKRS